MLSPTTLMRVRGSCRAGVPAFNAETSRGRWSHTEVPRGLGAQVLPLGFGKDLLGDGELVPLQHLHFIGVGREQAQGADADVTENLGAYAIVAQIGRMAARMWRPLEG